VVVWGDQERHFAQSGDSKRGASCANRRPPAQGWGRAPEGRQHSQESAAYGAAHARSPANGSGARAGHPGRDQCHGPRPRAPEIDLINADEEARIRELIAAGIWPQGWEGDEPIGTTVMDVVYQNGAVQPRLFSESEL
jgi:hypothetical protein